MQYLFDVWDHIVTRIGASRQILLLFDYDGTLTPIVERPELATLSKETRRFLKDLCHNKSRFTVGIVSGRALSDLRSRVGLSGIVYAGNHGLEIEGPGLEFVHPLAEEIKSVIRIISQVLSNSLSSIRGAIVEDKVLTLSVHYRLVEDEKEVDEVKDVFERVVGVARLLGKVRITSGKKVYEVRPAVSWHKGKAVKLLMKRHGKGGIRSGLLPIYVGDDLTDEDAFKVIEGYGGISVYVGGENPQSIARYYLGSPEEVNRFLQELLKLKWETRRWLSG